MAAVKKGLQKLVGKQVYVKHRYETDDRLGPFTLLSVDAPFIEFKHEDKTFWWNVNVLEAIREVPTETDNVVWKRDRLGKEPSDERVSAEQYGLFPSVLYGECSFEHRQISPKVRKHKGFSRCSGRTGKAR